MSIKFHYETTDDFTANTSQDKTAYCNNILATLGNAFVNAGTGWEFSDSGTDVNSTTTAKCLKIRTVELHHTVSNFYIRFWLIYQLGTYNIEEYSL